MVEFYKAEKVNDALTVIRSLTGEMLYLIEGEDGAILIDTCLGIRGLRDLVDQLTDKPVKVLLTHGHIDHAMGVPEFEEVYMNKKDREIYLSMRDIEGRKGYILGNLGGKLPGGLTDEDFLKPEDREFHDLQDGDSFDLGGLHVDVYGLPGHTPGSMVMLIREQRILILGDACNPFTFLFDENSLTVSAYQEELKKMQRRLEGKYDRVFVSHGVMDTDPGIMGNVIAVCQDILEGNTDDEPFEFMGMKAYIAKAMKDFRRVDGVEGNVVYNKSRL